MLERIIFSGFGGQGILAMGQFLAYAGMLEGKHVSWLPSYGPEMRGGTANCSVTLSSKPVSSPIVTQANCVVAMNQPSLDKFENSLCNEGLLIINSSIIEAPASRGDIEICDVKANDIADKLGVPQVANMVILGLYLAKRPIVKLETVISAMAERLGEKKAHLLDTNKKALAAGFKLAGTFPSLLATQIAELSKSILGEKNSAAGE